MPTIAKITLLFVVFVGLIGQGLVFPIINSLIMEPTGISCRRAHRMPSAMSITGW